MKYRLLQSFHAPTGNIRAGVIKTVAEWKKVFPEMEDKDFDIKTDWFEPTHVGLHEMKSPDEVIDELENLKSIYVGLKNRHAEVTENWEKDFIQKAMECTNGKIEILKWVLS